MQNKSTKPKGEIMADLENRVETPETAPQGQKIESMDSFIDSFTDAGLKRAFRETLNEDGSFNREKIRDLAGRMLSDRRALSRVNEMPESASKFKEVYKPDDQFANLFNEDNKGGEKIRKMFDKFDDMCMQNTIGQSKNKAVKDFLLKTFADNGLIDMTSEEEREAQKQQKLEDEKEILQNALGKNADLDKVQDIIDQFIEDETDGDDTVKAVFDAINNSAKGKLILYSLRNRIYGKPVPVMKTEIGTSLKALQKEYDDPNTTRERRKELAEKMNELEGIE